MTDNRVERRLAAVLAADVAGYSRLTGLDEEGTHVRLRERLRGLADPKISEHRGKVVKHTGDGVLAEFGSVVDAVRCAIEIQRGMAEQNATMPQVKQIEFRIGIHVGDIIVDDNDIFGDGVNIAARLEGIAEPGGVCISDDAQRQVRGKVDFAFEDMGPQNLKNIVEPMRAWRVQFGGLGAATAQPGSASGQAPVPTLPDKPSIAVLPFQNMSGDPEQEYFADGIVEDIITALSRMRNFFVIARNSSFVYKNRPVDIRQIGRELGVRYVLEGSVRKAGSRVRVTGQLIDATNGVHVWADKFGAELKDVFDLQDQITLSVVGALVPQLERVEIELVKRKSTESLNAYDCYMRGLANFHRGSSGALRDACEHFERAIRLDPNFAAAYGMAAWCYGNRNNHGWLSPAEFERMISVAELGWSVGKDDPIALAAAGAMLAQVRNEPVAGAALLERALAIAPSLAAAWHLSGWVRLYGGQAALAIEHMERSLRLNPVDPLRYGVHNGLAAANFLAGDYSRAASWAGEALREQPRYAPAIRMAAASCALAGETERAAYFLRRLLEVDPAMRISALKNLIPFRGKEDIERYVSGLRSAGLPE